MDWRLKALLHWMFSLPGGDRLAYVAQRRITGRVRTSPESLRPSVEYATRYVASALPLVGRRVDSWTCFEFGAGRELAVPLTLAALGVPRQVLVDLTAQVRLDLVNGVIEALPALLPDGRRLPILDPGGSVREQLARCGIDYRAPADAARTDLPDGSVDLITSTSTLEHIPRNALVRILAECRRILAASGVMVSHVACDDHYAQADGSITRLNFLKYSDRTWRWWNPPHHYQNRLRYSDYLEIMRDSGFQVVCAEPRNATADELRGFRTAWQPHRGFARYSDEDMTATHGYFVARRTPGNRMPDA
jgi:SAM-dependent methyltransferase